MHTTIMKMLAVALLVGDAASVVVKEQATTAAKVHYKSQADREAERTRADREAEAAAAAKAVNDRRPAEDLYYRTNLKQTRADREVEAAAAAKAVNDRYTAEDAIEKNKSAKKKADQKAKAKADQKAKGSALTKAVADQAEADQQAKAEAKAKADLQLAVDEEVLSALRQRNREHAYLSYKECQEKQPERPLPCRQKLELGRFTLCEENSHLSWYTGGCPQFTRQQEEWRVQQAKDAKAKCEQKNVENSQLSHPRHQDC